MKCDHSVENSFLDTLVYVISKSGYECLSGNIADSFQLCYKWRSC